MVKEITPGQIKIIRTIISERKMDHMKDDLILSASDGRTNSTKELYFAEADALIKTLNVDSKKKEDKSYKMRGKILSMAHEMQWYLPGTRKLNYARINEWCEKFGYLHKRLDRYTYSELPKLVTQFESVHKDYLKKI